MPPGGWRPRTGTPTALDLDDIVGAHRDEREHTVTSTMRKIRLAVMLGALMTMLMALVVGPAAASEHNQKSCEEAGGTWESYRGDKTCTFETTEEGKNTKFECTTTEEYGGKGNLKNQPTYDENEEATSPQPGSGKCPPGQFKD
jgi:hypothetical protein